MAGVISDLKAQARILHHQVIEREPIALARAQQVAEWRDSDTAALPRRIKRRHCLAVIARELGFQGWSHAAAVLRGTDSSDFGTLLYPKWGHVHWNIWSAFVPMRREPFASNTVGTCSYTGSISSLPIATSSRLWD